jgi:SAM-dependent methyltransferase
VFERHLVPVYLPSRIFQWLVGMKRMFIPPKTQLAIPDPVVNLYGDRQIEWAYIASRLPVGSGWVLDFGAGHGDLSILAIQKGHRVIALDLEENVFHWTHQSLERIRGDLLTLQLPPSKFDFVVNCSTVEHVGLNGRYGVAESESDGDLGAMAKLRELLKPSGRMLMTVPCGRDAVIVPWHRVYGQERLPRLLEGYEVEEECYWKKQADNIWYLADKESAVAYIPTRHPTKGAFCSYAIGCFVLRKRANS